MSITKVRGQACDCKQCGQFDKDSYFTPINSAGPFCAACIDEETDTEEQENSQHGAGA